MSHLSIFELFLHLLPFFSSIYPILASLKISRKVSGILISLWFPFQLIFVALIPLALFHLLEAFDIIIKAQYPFLIFEHLLISFSFLILGYSFKKIEETLEEYRKIMSKVRASL